LALRPDVLIAATQAGSLGNCLPDPVSRRAERVRPADMIHALWGEIGTKPMSAKGQDGVREEIAKLLASGLQTKTEPFPETDKEFSEILSELREVAPGDLETKLVIAGFLDHPFGEEQYRCLECMYYLVHRKWCDLPELALPVEPEWWCRLWRI
jgi:hypothetical protein